MSRVVNATKLASQLAHVAKQLRGEADRWTGTRRAVLTQNSAQLSYTIGATLRDPETAEAVLEAGRTVLALAMTQRADLTAAAFLADPIGYAND